MFSTKQKSSKWWKEGWKPRLLVSFIRNCLRYLEVKWKSLSCVRLFVTLWTVYTVYGILQARILESVVIPFSRGFSQPKDWTQVSCIAGGFFNSWAIREAQELLEWVAHPFSSGPSQPRNRTSCTAGGFFTNWATRGALGILPPTKLQLHTCHNWKREGICTSGHRVLKQKYSDFGTR